MNGNYESIDVRNVDAVMLDCVTVSSLHCVTDSSLGLMMFGHMLTTIRPICNLVLHKEFLSVYCVFLHYSNGVCRVNLL